MCKTFSSSRSSIKYKRPETSLVLLIDLKDIPEIVGEKEDLTATYKIEVNKKCAMISLKHIDIISRKEDISVMDTT